MTKFVHLLGKRPMVLNNPVEEETLYGHTVSVFGMAKLLTGTLASRATQRGEPIRFDREYERMRTGLMRAKNVQTLRAELSDFFARGGSNKTLRESWKDLLPLFTGSDWQRAKDLALFALASYSGKGLEQIETVETNDTEEE